MKLAWNFLVWAVIICVSRLAFQVADAQACTEWLAPRMAVATAGEPVPIYVVQKWGTSSPRCGLRRYMTSHEHQDVVASAFDSGASPLIVDGLSHLMGIYGHRSLWSMMSLKNPELSVKIGHLTSIQQLGDADVYMDTAVDADTVKVLLAANRPVFLVVYVRDLEDIVLTGYDQHKNKPEDYVDAKMAQLNWASYRETLNGLDTDNGLLLEFARVSSSLGDSLPRLLELAAQLSTSEPPSNLRIGFVRVEDLAATGAAGYRSIGEWFGLSGVYLDQYTDSAKWIGNKARKGKLSGTVVVNGMGMAYSIDGSWVAPSTSSMAALAPSVHQQFTASRLGKLQHVFGYALTGRRGAQGK